MSPVPAPAAPPGLLVRGEAAQLSGGRRVSGSNVEAGAGAGAGATPTAEAGGVRAPTPTGAQREQQLQAAAAALRAAVVQDVGERAFAALHLLLRMTADTEGGAGGAGAGGSVGSALAGGAARIVPAAKVPTVLPRMVRLLYLEARLAAGGDG